MEQELDMGHFEFNVASNFFRSFSFYIIKCTFLLASRHGFSFCQIYRHKKLTIPPSAAPPPKNEDREKKKR